jgi:hypothetical protein
MAGHEVEIARDGDSAIETARANLPEVLVLDIGLPGLNGHEVALMLHKKRASRTAYSLRRPAKDRNTTGCDRGLRLRPSHREARRVRPARRAHRHAEMIEALNYPEDFPDRRG